MHNGHGNTQAQDKTWATNSVLFEQQDAACFRLIKSTMTGRRF
ncbi:hypothetical protein BN134_395 [Cronobacter dublinensis 1210]|uniref:Uncharacterized protein n=1 Tax=Cronobacter dublinensis 1210 TaxID=1208656 RepID=A0ABM9Q2R3_9ENTR|nr:hypothetical protein BN134_395 [Cronobacter dublinensis 1210]